MRTLLLILLALPAWHALAREPLSKDAAAFVARGAAHALRACDLPRRSCSGRSLVVQAKERGSSNDEERTVETLIHPGMSATVVFPVPRPRAYYLATVEISTAQWSTLFGLAPGAGRSAVLTKLGTPNGQSAQGCDEYFNEEIESLAVVCYRGATVARIRWEYFVD